MARRRRLVVLVPALLLVLLAMSLRSSWALSGLRQLSATARSIKRKVAAVPAAIPVGPLGDGDLLKELKAWRMQTANELQRPVYKILSNQLLDDLVLYKPASLDHLAQLSGIGKVKLARFGSALLEIVGKYPRGRVPMPGPCPEDTSTFWKPATREKAPKPAKPAKVATKGDFRGNLEVMSPDSAAALPVHQLTLDDLNDEKRAAVDVIMRGHNMFVSGSAGTGKSHLMKYIIQELCKQHGAEAVAVTAPTGIAAVNIGGQTLHSFAGVGISIADRDAVVRKVLKNLKACERWRNTRALVIDEVSMVDRELFELLDRIAREVRASDAPFGGLQLLVVGDFLQLPPVQRESIKNFCFQSPLWEAAGLNLVGGNVYLERVERQTDAEFVRHLNQVRLGVLTREFHDKLQACHVSRKALPSNGIVPTKLYALNRQVDEENAARLAELPGEATTITALDKWKQPPQRAQDAKDLRKGVDDMIPEAITLKVGAQVMLLRNRARVAYSSGGGKLALVNGSRGKIVDLVPSVTVPGMTAAVVEFDNGVTAVIGPTEFSYFVPGKQGAIVRYQVPLKLAWATTVHKSQGCTLTSAELMLSRTFDFGQAYVALSRVQSLDGLWLSTPIRPEHVQADPSVLDFYGFTPRVRLGNL